ncbi:MAG: universal stress protein [Candidatus Competibacterales bacterium]
MLIGPHRRQALKDVFVGTTAERAVRTSRRPILMANGVASGPYRQALVAVDFSQCSRDTLGVIQHLGLEQLMAISVVHVFDASETSVMKRSAVGDEHLQDYLEEEQQRALLALDGFLAEAHFKPIQRLVKHNDSSTAHVIHEAAREISADLLVVGTHGRTGIAKFLLGSVAQEVLRSATFDVLVARHFASS